MPADDNDLPPTWAETWVRGRCGCGARLCRAECYCGGHTVCSASGKDPADCTGKVAAE